MTRKSSPFAEQRELPFGVRQCLQCVNVTSEHSAEERIACVSLNGRHPLSCSAFLRRKHVQSDARRVVAILLSMTVGGNESGTAEI